MGALTHPLTFGDTMAMFGSDWFENSEDEDEGFMAFPSLKDDKKKKTDDGAMVQLV